MIGKRLTIAGPSEKSMKRGRRPVEPRSCRRAASRTARRRGSGRAGPASRDATSPRLRLHDASWSATTSGSRDRRASVDEIQARLEVAVLAGPARERPAVEHVQRHEADGRRRRGIWASGRGQRRLQRGRQPRCRALASRACGPAFRAILAVARQSRRTRLDWLARFRTDRVGHRARLPPCSLAIADRPPATVALGAVPRSGKRPGVTAAA